MLAWINELKWRTAAIVVLSISVAAAGYGIYWYISNRPEREFRAAALQLMNNGDLSIARNGFLNYLRQRPAAIAPRYDLGLLAERQENWAEAIKWYRQVLVFTPEKSQLSAQVATHIKRCEEAAADDARPQGKQQRRYREMIGRAHVFATLGLPREAIAEAAEAKKLKPDGWEVYLVTADALMSQRQYQLASEQIKFALRVAPAEKQAVLQKALALTDKEKAAVLNAQKIYAQGLLGIRQHQYLAAAHAFQNAWLVSPNPNYEFAAAEALIAGGKGRDAKAVLQDITNRYKGPVANKAHMLSLKLVEVHK